MIIVDNFLVAFGVRIISIESIVSKAVELYLAEKKALDREGQASGSDSMAPGHADMLSPPSEGAGSIPLNPSSSMELVVGPSGTALHDQSASDRVRPTVQHHSPGHAPHKHADDNKPKPATVLDGTASDGGRGQEGGGVASEGEGLKGEEGGETDAIKTQDSEDSVAIKVTPDDMLPVSLHHLNCVWWEFQIVHTITQLLVCV